MNYLFLAQRIYIKKKSLEKDLGLKHFCKFTSCKSFFGFACLGKHYCLLILFYGQLISQVLNVKFDTEFSLN